MTDKSHMHFYRGKIACRGQFFASAGLKVILAYLILQYDIKHPEGKSRLANLDADDFMYPDPKARLRTNR